MYAHFSGTLAFLSPTMVIIDCHGIGYELHISLNTYEKIKSLDKVTLFAHLVVKEDGHLLYGFAEQGERTLFRQLISVNGIGAATARMILSSLSAHELQHAILTGNVSLLKSVKGVGPKSAQRIILELQDKLQKSEGNDMNVLTSGKAVYNQKDEAIAALLMLGFAKPQIEKAVASVTQGASVPVNVEDIIKQALKRL
jgi:Holliday junction DNA helicase RuvA